MDKEIYKSPDSDVDSHKKELEGNAIEIGNRNAKFVLAALLVTPIVTTLIYCGMIFSLAFIENMNGNAGHPIGVDFLMSILLVSLGLSFVFSLIVGLPLNWFLTKINKVRLIYFLIIGALIPIFFSYTASDNRDILLMLQIGATGSICLGTFWFVAAYLPSRQRP
jgi:predicted membrane channel-forming protein YqfA (hemolysin III family)